MSRALLHRLTDAEILTTFRVMRATCVSAADPRLRSGITVRELHTMAVFVEVAGLNETPVGCFVEWPDASLGMTFLEVDDVQRTRNLVAAYEAARHALEHLAMSGLELSSHAH